MSPSVALAPFVAPSVDSPLGDRNSCALWPMLPQFLHVPLNVLLAFSTDSEMVVPPGLTRVLN
jgi:hypothetical protein